MYTLMEDHAMVRAISPEVQRLARAVDALESRVSALERLVGQLAEVRADRRRRLDEPEEPSAEIALTP